MKSLTVSSEDLENAVRVISTFFVRSSRQSVRIVKNAVPIGKNCKIEFVQVIKEPDSKTREAKVTETVVAIFDNIKDGAIYGQYVHNRRPLRLAL